MGWIRSPTILGIIHKHRDAGEHSPFGPSRTSTETSSAGFDRGTNSGDVVVLPEAQTGAVAYAVRYALQGAGGVLGPWTVVTAVKPRKVTISGLTLAGIYQFQIRALGVLGYTDWMDTKTFVVA